MTFFADSSALIKLYVQEIGSQWIRSLFDPATGNACYVSRVTSVEVTSGLARRVREGRLDLAAGQHSVAQLRTDFRLLFRVIELTPALTDSAMNRVSQHGLRAYDAVQLATALETATAYTATGLPAPTFLCSDTRLTAAALAEGLQVDDPNQHP